MAETRLDVFEASLEELYQGQRRLLGVESLQEEAGSRIDKVESLVDRLMEDTKDFVQHLHEVVVELTSKVTLLTRTLNPDKVQGIPGDDGDNGRSNYESRSGEHFDDLPGPANIGGSNGAHQPKSLGPNQGSDGSQPEPSGPTDHTSNERLSSKEIGNVTVDTFPSLIQVSVVFATLQYLVTELCITWKPVLNI
ncbi:hypothetical protein BHM03_00019580 [Ensete ventricosum]|nr:hypothetical protein BHM03_00019580 [Ensete ventricosum]